jgi:hypothetical protein
MGIVCKWMVEKRTSLLDYMAVAALSGNPIACKPSHWWWVIITGISALTDSLIDPVFTKLQDPTLLLLAQRVILTSLAIDISTLLRISN